MQNSKWRTTVDRYIAEGRTVSGGCGATSAETQIQAAQAAYYTQMTANAQQEFGDAATIFSQLSSQFSPILAAGPNQQGYSPAEIAQLNSQAATGIGQEAAMAKESLNSQTASLGGSANLPSGAALEADTGVAVGAGQQLAGTELNTQLQSEELGQQNWLNAAKILGGATGTFSQTAGLEGAANTGGADAFTSAQGIQQANDQWAGDLTSVIGSAAGAAGTAL